MIKNTLEIIIPIKEHPLVQNFEKSIDTLSKSKGKGDIWVHFVKYVIEHGLRVVFIERFQLEQTQEHIFDVFIGFVEGDLDLFCAGRTSSRDITTLQKKCETCPDFIFSKGCMNSWEGASKEEIIASFLDDLKNLEFEIENE